MIKEKDLPYLGQLDDYTYINYEPFIFLEENTPIETLQDISEGFFFVYGEIIC